MVGKREGQQAIITGLLLTVTALGGMSYYSIPAAGLAITALMLILAGYWLVDLLWFRKQPPGVGLIFVGALFAALANGLGAVSVGRLLLLASAHGVAAAARQISPDIINRAVYWAGLIWPAVAIALHNGPWLENRNILAAITLIYLLQAIVERGVWDTGRFFALRLTLYVLLLLWLGSRGALLGLAAGLLVWAWPAVGGPRPVVGLAVLLLLAGLILWRPDTALLRLHYWQAAWAAWLENIWFGIGPGGLWTRQIISEPGGGWQIHSHNLIITWLSEMGLIGLLLAVSGVAAWLYTGQSMAVIIILAGIATHSMVDDPLWFPGPLLLTAVILGAVGQNDRADILSSSINQKVC